MNTIIYCFKKYGSYIFGISLKGGELVIYLPKSVYHKDPYFAHSPEKMWKDISTYENPVGHGNRKISTA